MAGTAGSGATAVYYRQQLPIDYIDTSLVINTWETIVADLSSGRPCQLGHMYIEQTNNGATAEDIELEITINGTAYTWTIAAASGTPYYLFISSALTAGDFQTASSATSYSVGTQVSSLYKPFNAAYVSLIRVRQTSDVDGISAQIEFNLAWDKLVAVA